MKGKHGIKASARRRFLPKLNITFKGEAGKHWRRGAYLIAALAALVLFASLLRPEVQLMHTAEMERIKQRGVLIVGVRSDIPGFAEEGEGFEIELASRFAQYLLPDTPKDNVVKLVEVSGAAASAKLSDGSVDVAIALMDDGIGSSFSYSYAYYTDSCNVIVNAGDENTKLEELTIGYVQNTASARMLFKYKEATTITVEPSFIEKLLGKEPAEQKLDDAHELDVKAFASYPDLLDALERKEISAAVMSGVYCSKYDDEYGFKYNKYGSLLGTIGYSVAASSDEPALAQLADMFIYDLKESGELDSMLKKYGLGGTAQVNMP